MVTSTCNRSGHLPESEPLVESERHPARTRTTCYIHTSTYYPPSSCADCTHIHTYLHVWYAHQYVNVHITGPSCYSFTRFAITNRIIFFQISHITYILYLLHTLLLTQVIPTLPLHPFTNHLHSRVSEYLIWTFYPLGLERQAPFDP